MEGDPANVRVLYDAGVRMISFSHFVDTDLGGSAHGETKGGLTPLGRRTLDEMAKLSIIFDLAHASPALIDDALKDWKGALVVSHTGVRGTCDNQRNLSDDQLRALSARGALIGIGFWSVATCGSDADAIARAVAYAVKIAGPRAVALGSDFDGAVAMPFDATAYPSVAAALARAGISPDVAALVMGGNARRFMLEHLPSAH
jgi:microsomal dipeptidase-like Zn-dependent dipeptidase